MSRSEKTRRENRPAIRVLQGMNVCLARIYHRLKVLSPQCLPRNGAAILVSNHVSGLDPLLIQSVCPRLISWMVAKEYCQARGLRWVFKQIEAIPVERSGRDLSSTRSAMRALANGTVLGVFPEGRIETSHELLPFQTGVALMAMKTEAPVFPVYVDGTQRGREIAEAVLRPCKASVAFGPAVEFDRSDRSKPALEAATQKIMKAVSDLRDKWPKADLI